jgi:general secretion pathway protein A
MMEAFFGFKKTPFGDHPDGKQLFPSQAYTEAKARLQFLADHHGAGLLTGEVGSGKSTAARTFTAGLNPNLYKILYIHWTPGPLWISFANWPWSSISNRRTTAATWCARSPPPS